MGIQFRSFRNDDPPHLVDIWNQALSGRGAVRLRHCSPFETYVFSKPYFDPHGLIVADEDGQRLGYAHCGFPSDDAGTALQRDAGIICLLGVRPTHRRRGLGAELVKRCETYLQSHGAQTIYAGQTWPQCPYYFGLYGGSQLAGFLDSDSSAQPFFLGQGYQIHQSFAAYQRSLTLPMNIADGRFPDIRRHYEVCVPPRPNARQWWQECVLGPIDVVEFQLEETAMGKAAAHASVWDMEGFSWRWSQPAIGLLELRVAEEFRRRGLAKFMLLHLFRYLQEHFFNVIESQVDQSNAAAISLLRAVGFEQVDASHVYVKRL